MNQATASCIVVCVVMICFSSCLGTLAYQEEKTKQVRLQNKSCKCSKACIL